MVVRSLAQIASFRSFLAHLPILTFSKAFSLRHWRRKQQPTRVYIAISIQAITRSSLR